MKAFVRARRALFQAAAVVMLAGCEIVRPVTFPMQTTFEVSPCKTVPNTLLVMLPGSYSTPDDFVQEGFVAAVRERGIAADLMLPDAHLGYYRDHSILDRLQADVIVPARARGYRQVWLVGISIGAFGALLYAAVHPQDVDGIVAIGPYLGQRTVTGEIRDQGGLATWRAPEGPLDPENVDTILWRWLKPYATGGEDRPPLFLGYGRSDRFVADDTLLAAALPPDRVFTAEGGHDWAPWQSVWRQALDRLPLTRDMSCKSKSPQ